MWGKDQNAAIEKVSDLMAKISKLCHYDSSKQSRIEWDASHRFQILTDHKAVISALNEHYNKNRINPGENVPGVTLGIFDYMSRYRIFNAPLTSQYDKLFVAKSVYSSLQ